MEKQLIWKTVPGYPEYEVSEYGDLRRDGKILKPERTVGNGRKRFALSKDGAARRYKAAQLVLMAFVGHKPFRRAMACHRDGNEQNDHYSNLRWGNHQSNMDDAVMHRAKRNANSPFATTREQQLALATAQFLASVQR